MKKIVSAALVASVILGGAGTALAASYENDGLTAKSDVSVTLELDSELIDIPNPGPEDPEIDPENPPVTNPEIGNFGIRYVSDMNFGVHNVSTDAQEFLSTFDEAFLNESQFNHLVVQNFEADNNGWSITVEQEGAFIPGSTLTFAPGMVTDSTIMFSLPATLDVTADNGAQDFVSDANGLGITTLILNSNGVKLAVPANTAVGEYNTVLVWNIVAGA